MQIKALKALTIRVSESGDLVASENEEIGNLVSIAHGAIAEVPEAVGESLINDSLAEKVTEGDGGSDVVKGIVERNITSVTADMLEGVTSIGKDAFASCSSLTSATIPEGVTSIGGWSFLNCTSLTSVTVLATTPPALGTEAFSNTHSDLKIYVPAESVDAYKAASGWSDYASKIQAIPS